KNLEEIDHVKAEEYRRQIKLMSDMAKHHLLVKQQQTQKKTKEQFEKASNPDEDHLYLVNKKIKPYGIIKQDGKKLLIPIYNKDRVLWSVQEIHEDGFKHFPKNTQKKGNASYIDGNGNDNIYICEGYSTGCSIHEVTKGTVIVSFDAGNLVPVAKIAKNKYPKSNIIICADNDTTNPKKNPGLEFGKKSAKAINATLTYPIFTKETYSKFKQSERPSDFNDLLNLEGFEVAKKQLFGATEKHDFPPLTMEVS
ncbi:MAG: toprim domain-containing protein, partial [Bacteroidetes bacterium]|nr:toprim domain-containing protein [Bacteroidota bacterium]